MSLWIAGLGTAVPPHVVTQEDALEAAPSFCPPAQGPHVATMSRLVQRLYRHSGVVTRHSVVLENSRQGTAGRQSFYPPAADELDGGPSTADRMRIYEQAAPRLACEAATAALVDARLRASDITRLITVSCSGFSAPGFDVALFRELELSPRVSRTHVGFMGCHGALNALRVAEAYTTADPAATVLVCCVELCSLHYHYGSQADKLLANAIFADGAAALVARGGLPPENAWSLAGCGSAIVPDTEDLMTWSIRDHGFEMGLSPRLPDAIREHLRPWLTTWLAEHRLSVEQIGSWAIHPGGPKILVACAEATGLSPDQLWASEQILSRYGNMSSATVLFVLDLLRRQSSPRPCVALAFGPGLAIEAALWASPPR